GDMLGINSSYLQFLTNFSRDPVQALDDLQGLLEQALEQALGVTGPHVTMSLDTTVPGHPALEIAPSLNAALERKLPPALSLGSLIPGVGDLVDVSGSGSVLVSAHANLALNLGIDLSNPRAPHAFLYDTSLAALDAKVESSDIHFAATLGPVGLVVDNGSIAIDADGE